MVDLYLEKKKKIVITFQTVDFTDMLYFDFSKTIWE